MYAKKMLFVFCIACFLFVSCVRSKRVDGDILDYQRQVGVLEARISDYERTIAEYERTIGRTVTELESIRERANSFGGTIEEVIKLLDDYQRTVERLLRDYNRIEASTGSQDDSGNCPDYTAFP